MKNQNNLKIAFMLDASLDTEDGVQQYVLVLGDWLKQQGHEVHYIVGQSQRSDIENLHSFSKNLTVKYNGNKVGPALSSDKKAIDNLLKTQYFDVIHVQVPYSPFYAASVIKSAKAIDSSVCIIGTFHILPYSKLSYLGTWILGLYLRKNLKLFDRQISISPANKIFSSRTFGTESIVIPNMVKIKDFSPKKGFKRDNKVTEILFLGRLTERKGCLYLIKALALLLNNYPETKFHLTVAGKGEDRNKLEELVKLFDLEEHVTFLGFVSNEQKINLMQNADIAVFPAYAGECFGIVLIEAMAAKSGVVIGGCNPGYETVLGSVEGSLVDVKNIEAFSSHLRKLVIDENYREKLYKKQQKLIGQYDYEVVGKQVLDVYLNCKNSKDKT